MPASRVWRSSTSRNCVFRVALGSARYSRFGRSNDPTSSTGSFSPSCAAMSRLTRAVAVAVYAPVKGNAGQKLSEPSQLAILGPEVVAPLADAVGFVNRDKLDRTRRNQQEKTFAAIAHETFRRNAEQPIPLLPQPDDDIRLCRQVRASCCKRPRKRRCRRACPPDLSSAKSTGTQPARCRVARRPVPGSRAICPRRLAARRWNRVPRAPPPSLRVAMAGTCRIPSSAKSRLRDARRS